jgi:hypothetical protein
MAVSRWHLLAAASTMSQPGTAGSDRVHDRRNVVRMAPRLHLPTVMTSQALPEPWQRAEARHTVASDLRTHRDAGLAAA